MIKKDRQVLVFKNTELIDKIWANTKKQDLLEEGYNLVKEVHNKKLIKVDEEGKFVWDKKNPFFDTLIFEN